MYLCAGLGDGTEVVDHVSLGHADATVTDGEDLVFFVWDDSNEKLFFGIEDRGVSKGGIANFVESIGAVRDEFTKEDLFVGIESVCKRG
jgi:hypothetical protein